MTTVHKIKEFVEEDGFEVLEASMSVTLHLKKEGKDHWVAFGLDPLRDHISPHHNWEKLIADRIMFKFTQIDDE